VNAVMASFNTVMGQMDQMS